MRKGWWGHDTLPDARGLRPRHRRSCRFYLRVNLESQLPTVSGLFLTGPGQILLQVWLSQLNRTGSNLGMRDAESLLCPEETALCEIGSICIAAQRNPRDAFVVDLNWSQNTEGRFRLTTCVARLRATAHHSSLHCFSVAGCAWVLDLQAGAIEAAVAGVPHFQSKSRSPGVRLADLRASIQRIGTIPHACRQPAFTSRPWEWIRWRVDACARAASATGLDPNKCEAQHAAALERELCVQRVQMQCSVRGAFVGLKKTKTETKSPCPDV